MPQNNEDDDMDGVPRALDEIQLQPQALLTITNEAHIHSTLSRNENFYKNYHFNNTQLVITSIGSENSEQTPPTRETNARQSRISFQANKLSQSDDLPDYTNVIAAKRQIRQLQDPAAYISPDQQTAGYSVPYNYPTINAPLNANINQKHNSANKYLFESLFGCIKPLFGIWGTRGVHRSSANNTAVNIVNTTSFANQNFKGDECFEIDFERIKNMEFIDSGAQGSVYKATLDDQVIAVKKLNAKEDSKIKTLRQLNHPNLVLVKNTSICRDNFFYIIMEYCPNGVLYKYLKNTRENGMCLPPSKMLSWAHQIASGMHYLHSKKLIHRDLKSPNILIGDNHQMKITDFGQCKNLSSESKSNGSTPAGTVAWMAPEVIRNQPCTEKVDIWSFAVVLWELITCEVPYENIESNAIIYGVGNNELHLCIPEKLPNRLKNLLQSCWDIKPLQRPNFSSIIKILEFAKSERLFKNDKEYFDQQKEWRKEVSQGLATQKQSLAWDTKFGLDITEIRDEERRQATFEREKYEKKVEMVNNLYLELNCVIVQLNEREKEICRREKLHNITPKRVVPSLLKREFFVDKEKRHATKEKAQNFKSNSEKEKSTKEAAVQTENIPEASIIKEESTVEKSAQWIAPNRDALNLELQSKNRIMNNVDSEFEHTLSPSSVKYFEREYSKSFKSSNNNLSDSSCSLDEDDTLQRQQTRGSKRSMKSIHSCNAIRNGTNDSSRTFSPPFRRKHTSFTNVNSLRSSKRSFSSRGRVNDGNASSENDEPEQRDYKDIIDDEMNRKKYEHGENRFSLNYSSEGGVVSDEGNTSERPQSSQTMSCEENAQLELDTVVQVPADIEQLNIKLMGSPATEDVANAKPSVSDYDFLEIAESTRI